MKIDTADSYFLRGDIISPPFAPRWEDRIPLTPKEWTFAPKEDWTFAPKVES